ncbi:hypothetical protein L198_08171 [Cryptococcus wingfieldii CBS 7118]|uniref:C2H2-type domain-containing protein n=1 Tax=Cryptococcus wingfieldii CBS 7118 TaxID=1295528 RepID=A0A1E3HFT2_9TREE|nr:hypothetical protein L198_08171 [Cryptococcus wingfieldii CBS 7118]ODN74985.1 hypothetical protein L198_08171 [Cryptococcus wingfieldii CBS 7118]
MPANARNSYWPYDNDPKRTTLQGRITPTSSSAASRPSSSNITQAPAGGKAKRVATASLEAQGYWPYDNDPKRTTLQGRITPTSSSAASRPSSSNITQAPAGGKAKRVATASLEAKGYWPYDNDPKRTTLQGRITPTSSSAASRPSSSNITQAPAGGKAKRVATASLEAEGYWPYDNDPKRTTLQGRITPTSSSAASRPSSSNITQAPAGGKAKRVATASLEAEGFTAKKSRVGGEQFMVNPPASKTAPRRPIASTRNELASDDIDDGISPGKDDDDDDDGSGNLKDAMRVTGDDFWIKYLLKPLEQHASRLGLNPAPLPETTYKRLSEVLDFVLADKSVYFVWTVNSMSKNVRKRLLRLLGFFMPTNFQELLAGRNPPSAAQIHSLIDANGVYCNEHGVRVDKLEGRSEVHSRCVGAYWKVALPKGSVHHHPPLRILIYTGQTAQVSPSDNSMGFRVRWEHHLSEVYRHDKTNKKDSLFTKAFIESQEEYRMAFVPIVTVPVPVGTKLDIPFRNAVKFFARLSEAICHEACSTIYRVDPGCAHTPKSFWTDSPREYTGMNSRDPLRESFGFWELGKPQRPSPKCSTCRKPFETKTSRDRHEVEVHGPKAFVCGHDGCKMRCTSENRLETHRKDVHGEKEHDCDRCESKFKTLGRLNEHRRDVHGDKVHACDECEKKFTTNSLLKVHRKRAHGEEEFACKIEGCKRKYRTEGLLNTHKKNVHGEEEHACDECEKKYRSKTLLKAHIKNVHQEKTVSCREIGCRTMFRYQSQARTHPSDPIGDILCPLVGWVLRSDRCEPENEHSPEPSTCPEGHEWNPHTCTCGGGSPSQHDPTPSEPPKGVTYQDDCCVPTSPDCPEPSCPDWNAHTNTCGGASPSERALAARHTGILYGANSFKARQLAK